MKNNTLLLVFICKEKLTKFDILFLLEIKFVFFNLNKFCYNI